jgi:hypothetical protein
VILAFSALGLLSLPQPLEALKPTPVVPFTEVFIRNGQMVIVGSTFEATAGRFILSADGKRLELRGSTREPATFRTHPKGNPKDTLLELSGERIIYSPAEGSFHIDGSGRITESKQSK